MDARTGPASKTEALQRFESDTGERPLAVAIIGENGCERVWLSDKIETPEQREWAAKHLRAAADQALKMEPRMEADNVIISFRPRV